MCKWCPKFQFLFLNLFSKVLAGVIVRTSKYPYMDICVVVVIATVKKNLFSENRIARALKQLVSKVERSWGHDDRVKYFSHDLTHFIWKPFPCCFQSRSCFHCSYNQKIVPRLKINFLFFLAFFLFHNSGFISAWPSECLQRAHGVKSCKGCSGYIDSIFFFKWRIFKSLNWPYLGSKTFDKDNIYCVARKKEYSWLVVCIADFMKNLDLLTLIKGRL